MRHSVGVALVLLATIVCNADDVPVAPRETGPTAENSGPPRIVRSGNELVVLWGYDHVRFARIRSSDEIRLAGEMGRPGHVLAAVAGPSGMVLAAFLDADGIHVARIAHGGEVQFSDAVASSFSSMAWNGTRLLIVTRDGDTIFTDVSGRIVGRGSRLAVPEGTSSVSARGSGFVIAWIDRFTVHVKTLTNDGDVTLEQTVPDQFTYSVSIGCANANTCLLLTPVAARILDGESIGGAIRISEDFVDSLPPVWDGQRFLVAWTENGAIRVAGIEADASVTPLATLASPGRNRYGPAVAHANGETVVAWNEGVFCGYAGWQVIARSLATNRDLRLTNGLSAQGEPAIAAAPGTALVAWAERAATSRIRARVFPFTEPAFDVSDGPASSAPVIGTDGNNYLVAWREGLPDDECRYALRISIAGSGTIHTLARGVDSGVQITWNGSEYVVLWEEDDPAELFAVRVARDGTPIDPVSIPLSPSEKEPDHFTSIDHEPAGLFWTGDGYLLVWRRSRTAYIPLYPDPPPQFDVRATRLAPNLIPAGPPQTIAPAYTLAAAMKGDTIVALWYLDGSLRAVRLSPGGTVLETRDLGIRDSQPVRLIATRTGYAILRYQEILFLDDDLTLTGRRAVPHFPMDVADTPAGLVVVYEEVDSVLVSPPAATSPRRRRSVR